MATEKSSSKKQAWFFCTTGLPSDIEIEVEDITFHLHKLPLMLKSRKLQQLITEHEQSLEESDVYPHIKLENFPGGSDIFEMVVKISYGFKVVLSTSTVVPLRCAVEFLEMTEEYSPENLISKTEKFLSQFVFNSVRESIKALKACESVSSLADSLGITEQCIDSIIYKASSVDPPSFLFGWPINKGANFVVDPTERKKQGRNSETELWFADLTDLSFPIFKRVIVAMKSRDLSPEIVESSLIRYARKHIPGISRSSSTSSSSSTIASENQQRDLLETITSELPLNNFFITAKITRSLFRLLRSAIILNASENCRTFLEKKIGLQLEKATLDDLLNPSYSYLNETLYDIDLVERLVRHFLENAAVSFQSLMVVAKSIDGVLGEIASDANLKPEKFYNLAILLPVQARLYDDGLYRAVDIYLKTHPYILEAEKEKICSVMDWKKVSVEGCTHAAQNERLPLRAVVQVLLLEQLQLRHLITGTLMTVLTEEDGDETVGEGEVVDFWRWKKSVKENQMLRSDMDTMRTRLKQLEKECSSLKKVIDKLHNEKSSAVNEGLTKWLTGTKFGCKFTTQVCDSHESTIVDQRSRRF